MSVKNLQNFPRDPKIRKLIIPRRDDEVLIACDLSQAEARVVAWKAKEETQKELFRSGKKIHEYFASLVVGEQVTKKSHPKEYETAKRAIHGGNYGLHGKRLAEIMLDELGLAIRESQAQTWLNQYLQTFPGIKSGFHQAIQNELRYKNCTITTPIGMHRKFYSMWGDSLFREAYAYYPQNVVAFVTNNALNQLYYDTWLKDHLYMQVHDEIILSVPVARQVEAIFLLKAAMTYKLEIEGDELIIPVEVKVGRSYGEMQEVSSEELKEAA